MPAETISWQTGSGDGSHECHFLAREKQVRELRQWRTKLWWNSGSLRWRANNCERAEMKAGLLHCSGLGPGRLILQLESWSSHGLGSSFLPWSSRSCEGGLVLIAALPAWNKPQPHESLAQECLPEVGICPHKTPPGECITKLEFALKAEVIGQWHGTYPQ